MKKCPKCKTLKQPFEFYKNRSRCDGLGSCCKLCKTIMVEKYRKTPKGRKVAKQAYRKYRKTLKGKKLASAIMKRYYKYPENKEKRRK